MKRLLCILAAAALVFTGCAGRQTPPPEPPYQPTLVPITQEQDAAWWWENYIFPAAYQMQSGMGGNPIRDQGILLEQAVSRAALDGRAEEITRETTWVTRPVLDEYLHRYFPVENADGLYLVNYTDDQGRIGVYSEGYWRVQRGPDPEDPPNGDWAFLVTQVEKLDDCRVEVTVITQDENYPEGWRRKNRYVMAHTGENQYLYETVTEEYPAKGTQPTQFTGNYQLADTLGLLSALSGTQAVNGEKGSTLYDVQYSWESGLVQLAPVDAATLKPIAASRMLGLEKGEEIWEKRQLADGYLLTTSRRMLRFSEDLTQMEEQPLPQAVLERKGWTGFSPSPDERWAAYSDADGLHLLELATGENRVIAPHPHYNPAAEGKEILSQNTWGNATWSGDSRYLLVNSYGYEWVSGVMVYDLQTGVSRDLSELLGAGGQPLGILDGRVLLLTSENGSGSGGNLAVTIATGEVTPFSCPEEVGEWQYFIAGERLYLLQARSFSGAEAGDRVTTLFQVDPATGVATPTGFTAKGSPLVLASKAEGQLVFQYYSSSDISDQGFVSVQLP